MDVIINNPPAAPSSALLPAQGYAPLQATPYGYGPAAYGPYPHHHGPGFLLPLLLIGAFVLFRRRRFMARRFMAGGPDAVGSGADVAAEMRDKLRRHRDRFVNDSALHIARERYAKGEINADEYEALRRTLSGELRPDRPAPDQAGRDGDLNL